MLKLLENLSERMGISAKRNPLDPAVFCDPLAMRISWNPLERSGASFRTRKLVIIGLDRAEFRPTLGVRLFGWTFIGLGIAGFGWGVMELLGETSLMKFDSIICFFVGSVFLAAGVWMTWKSGEPVVFDGRSGYFWRGKKSPMEVANQNEIEFLAAFDEIHALQLISEYCRGNGGNEGAPYYSYELNLVLKSAERINVFDHGHLKTARSDAERLAEFLGKPVWDATRS